MKFHIFRLMEKHQNIDRALRAEQVRSAPNFSRVQQLKKMKQAVKDHLNSLVKQPLPNG